MYRLIFLNGTMKGRRLAVREGTIFIGRDPACHVELPGDDSVAPRHASIEVRDGAFFLCSTDAANLLHVNGQPVSETSLKNGDKIDVGRTQLEFHIIFDQSPVGTKRSVSGLQVATVAVIVAIVCAELYFVVIAPMRQKQPKLDPATLAAIRKRAAAMNQDTNAAPAADTNSPDMAQALLLINKIAAASNADPREVFTSPVPAAVTSGMPTNPPAPVAPPQFTVAAPTNDVSKNSALISTAAPPAAVSASTNDASKIIVSVATASPPAVVPAPVPAEPAEDPVVAAAKNMLQSASAYAATGDLAQADATLDRVQFMAPDYLPAYIERAKLLEKRGLYRDAAAQWKEVEKRAAGTPQAAVAKDEQQRLAKLEQEAKNAPRNMPPAASTNLTRRVRILSIERERFQASRDYDEMRVLRINLLAREGDAIQPADIRVSAYFYDRNVNNDRIALTRALVPDNTLHIEGVWPDGETKSVTATYFVPRNFRNEELRVQGDN